MSRAAVAPSAAAARTTSAPTSRFFATPPIDGAFCEYVALAADFAYPVPDSLSDDAAGLIEPLSVGVWANRKAGTVAGSRLLVSGAGPVGLLVTQVARALGAGEVVVATSTPTGGRWPNGWAPPRRSTPRRPSPAEAGVEADAFVDCSGAPAAVAAGVPAVRAGGSVVLVGMGADELTLPVALIQTRELAVTGTFRYANTWPAAIALAANGDVDLDALVTGHVDLEHAEESLAPDPDERHVKLVVRPNGL